MARYMAEVQGNRSLVSRLGSAVSGIWSHTRGWNIGARVDVDPYREDSNADMVSISVTGGSNGAGPRFHLANVWQTSKGVRVEVHTPKGVKAWTVKR